MRAIWAAGLLLRRIRTEPGIMAVLVVLVAATSFVFAAAPRLFNRVSDDAVRYAVNQAPAVQRNISLALADALPPGPNGGVSQVRAYGDSLATRFPPTLAALVDGRSLNLTSARFDVTNPPRFETHLSLQYQDGLTTRTKLVAGRWPVDRGAPLVAVNPFPGTGDTTEPAPVVLEVALSTDEAASIGVQLGDTLAITVDGTDALLQGRPHKIGPTEVQVVGLFEATDPRAAYWQGNTALLTVTQAGTLGHPVAYATAYVPAAMYGTLSGAGMPFRYEWRFSIDPQRLDAGQVPALQLGLRQLDFATGTSELVQHGTVVMRTSLLQILDAYAAQSALSASILAIAAIGPFALAAGALAMIAILLIARRRRTLVLARGRGASGLMVLGTQLWEAALLAGSAALVGLLAAVTLIPARASPLSSLLALAVGGAAVLLLVGASWPIARRPLGRLGRDDPPVLHVSPRRLVIELTIVGIAIGAVVLLRQRGLTIDTGSGELPRFDPLLAAVPVLTGLAAGIVAMRLYPLPIRALAWLAARRRGLVSVLGLRTIERNPAVANLPLLVLMLTAAFGAFSLVVVTSVNRGQLVASYQSVGADYRIEKIGIGAISPTLDPTTVPGVSAVAGGMVDPSARFASTPLQQATIELDAIDPGAYLTVTAGTPAVPDWPDSFLTAPSGAGLGTAQNPIPAIVSDAVPVGSGTLGRGQTFTVRVAAQEMTFLVVERRASFPGIQGSGPFTVVPFTWVQAAFTGGGLPPSVMWIRASPAAAQPLAASIADVASTTRLVSRYEAYAAVHDAPLGAAVGAGFALALGAAAVYMALTVIGALIFSAARRTQDLAYLRTLGVTRRQALGLTVVEHAPPVILALLPGAALGIAVAFLIEPGLGLASFVGISGAVPLVVDWVGLGLLLAALVVVVAVAVTTGTWLSRRARLVDALRIGED